MYNSINMFDVSMRESLSQNDNFFKLNNSDSNYTKFDNINLIPKINSLSFTGNESDLDNILDSARTIIEDLNDVILNEMQLADEDDIMNQHDSDESVYISSDYSGVYPWILQILNEEIWCDTPLVFWCKDHWNPNGISYSNAEYKQYLMIGVSDSSYTIS